MPAAEAMAAAVRAVKIAPPAQGGSHEGVPCRNRQTKRTVAVETKHSGDLLGSRERPGDRRSLQASPRRIEAARLHVAVGKRPRFETSPGYRAFERINHVSEVKFIGGNASSGGYNLRRIVKVWKRVHSAGAEGAGGLRADEVEFESEDAHNEKK